MKITTGIIEVKYGQTSNGRWVDIYSPWTYLSCPDDCDITINDFDGELGMACTGESDYYCAVNSHEARVFAWEIELACSIYDNWAYFWQDPNYFLQKMKCPTGKYPVVATNEN